MDSLENGTTAQGEATESANSAPDPKATEDQATAQPAGAKGKGPAPWAKDLSDRGLENPDFDAYLREVWQPRVTQLEQQLADGGSYSDLFEGNIEAARTASGLLQALLENPEEAYQELGELLGISPEQAEEVLEEALGDEQADGEDQYEYDPRVAWIEQQMEAQQAAEEDAAFEELLTGLSEEIPGFNADLFTHMVLAHGDDIEGALDAYMQFHQEPNTPQAPPTLGGGPGGVAPEENANPGSIRDAVGDFLAETNARRAS